MWLQNEAGVITRLKARCEGLMLSLGGDAERVSTVGRGTRSRPRQPHRLLRRSRERSCKAVPINVDLPSRQNSISECSGKLLASFAPSALRSIRSFQCLNHLPRARPHHMTRNTGGPSASKPPIHTPELLICTES
jgi:hypothetical protein